MVLKTLWPKLNGILFCRASPAAAFTPQKENCELSDHDTRDLNLNNPSFFETTGDYDFYERSPGRSNLADCLDGKIFARNNLLHLLQ